MKIIYEAENYIHSDKPLLLALGNFDGVHCGHKQLISSMVEQAHLVNGTTAAFVFNPHPLTILTPDKAPRMLVTPERKAQLMEQLDLDLLIFHSFSHEIASWSPQEFVERILVDALQVSEVFVGFNYSFGRQGMGTPDLLESLGKIFGFKTNIIPPVSIAGEVASSSLVRNYLQNGKTEAAYKILGYQLG